MPTAKLHQRLSVGLAACPHPTESEAATAPPSDSHHCRRCRSLLQLTENPLLQWCEHCRSVYLGGAPRWLGEVPKLWQPARLFRFLRGRLRHGGRDWGDLAYTRYFCDRFGLSLELALACGRARHPDRARIGRLGVAHGLLSCDEAAWILRFQRQAPPVRRRCFGDVAVQLGLWPRSLPTPLLAAQAERHRGLVRAIAEAHDIGRDQALAAERDFFGLSAAMSDLHSDSPLSVVMTADAMPALGQAA